MLKNAFLLLLSFTCIVQELKAQTDYDDVPDVTGKIFINDVYIQQFEPDTFILHDILVKDGIIQAIAPFLDAPVDARIIEADSMYVYPSFIDGFSHTGIPTPDRKDRQRPDVKFKGYPPNDVAGITPEKKAVSSIKADDKSIAELRSNGFAVSHVAPRGNMLPGQGSVISLKGKSTEDMILSQSSSMILQLDGARGVYPSTIIAVMSKWRELYRNATYYADNMALYSSDPVGKPRPKSDPVLEALVPVTESSQVVYAHAEDAKDVFRMLALEKELGYRIVIANLKNAGTALERLEPADLGIVLSADLPKEIKEKEDKKDGKDAAPADPRSENLLKRKKESLSEYESQAAKLEQAGFPFAFSMMDAKADDLKDNLNRMIAAGLSPKAALDALTINGAILLGIDKMYGSIEKGKVASFFISTGPYLDEDSKIKYTLIEGEVDEYEINKKSAKGTDETEFLIGRWSFEVDVMGDVNTGQMEISMDGDQLKAIITNDASPDNPRECTDISFEDNTLKLSLTVSSEGVDLPVELVLEMDGDSYSGTASIGDLGAFPIEGSKISSPEN